MLAEVDVFVGNSTVIDLEVYQLWLAGYTAQEAASVLHVQEESLRQMAVTSDLLVNDILDHYRTFQMLERLLHNPVQLAEQWTFQLNTQTQKMLIERYYEFDSLVVREFLGRKLSSRNRKELDEVSEKTSVNIRSCRRQFDNVKRVYKTVEDMTRPLVQSIETHFLLPETLARQATASILPKLKEFNIVVHSRKYAAISYITNNKFETGKKKLHYLSFDDFLHCAYQMMSVWSCTNPDCRYEETGMDMDREFLQELREMKMLLERDILEEMKALALASLKGKICDMVAADIEANFKSLSRSLVNIAYGLNHSKEVKDLFVDLVEKFVEPCRSARWTPSEVQHFLHFYKEGPLAMNVFVSEPHLYQVWERYIKTLSSMIIKLYHH